MTIGVSSTKPNTNKHNNPELKPRSDPNAKNNLKLLSLTKADDKAFSLPDGLRQTESQNQLTQDGPNEIGRKKSTPFQKFLNNLWGPIHG
jgi:magnesium-transporting ATPase (P-type)